MNLIKCFPVMITVLLLPDAQAKSAAKFMINWLKMEPCSNFNNVNTDMSRLKFVQVDELTVKLQGTFDIKKDIMQGPVTSKTLLEKEVVGGTYMHVMRMDGKNICNNLVEGKEPWTPYLSKLMPKLSNKCPIYKGTYDASNVDADTSGVELRKDLAGKYRAIVELYTPSETVPGIPDKFACYIVYLAVDPI